MARTGKASGIKFGAPPAEKGRSYDWDSIAKDLRARPGQWAEVFTDDRHSLVSAVRNGGISVLSPQRGFSSRTTNNVRDELGFRTCDLWMMYDPDRDAGEPDPPLCGARTREGHACLMRAVDRYGGRCFRHKDKEN